jgi:hypothetical protein
LILKIKKLLKRNINFFYILLYNLERGGEYIKPAEKDILSTGAEEQNFVL